MPATPAPSHHLVPAVVNHPSLDPPRATPMPEPDPAPPSARNQHRPTTAAPPRPGSGRHRPCTTWILRRLPAPAWDPLSPSILDSLRANSPPPSAPPTTPPPLLVLNRRRPCEGGRGIPLEPRGSSSASSYKRSSFVLFAYLDFLGPSRFYSSAGQAEFSWQVEQKMPLVPFLLVAIPNYGTFCSCCHHKNRAHKKTRLLVTVHLLKDLCAS